MLSLRRTWVIAVRETARERVDQVSLLAIAHKGTVPARCAELPLGRGSNDQSGESHAPSWVLRDCAVGHTDDRRTRR